MYLVYSLTDQSNIDRVGKHQDRMSSRLLLRVYCMCGMKCEAGPKFYRWTQLKMFLPSSPSFVASSFVGCGLADEDMDDLGSCFDAAGRGTITEL